MIQATLKQLKAIFSDIRKTIVGVIFLAVVGGAGGVLYLSKTLLRVSTDTLKSPTPLWATIVLVLVLGGYIYLKTSKHHSSLHSKKPKYYKYCPDCDVGISAKTHGSYCQCGTKYLEKCPDCNKRIVRDSGRVCSFCGHVFPINRIPVS